MKRKLFCCCLVFNVICFSVYSQLSGYKQIDSAQKVLKKYDSNSSDYFKTCLFISNRYILNENFDTAQIWLDEISESDELKKITALHYLHLSLQLIIYYNRNLNQLGIKESKNAIALAEKLNDSLLLQDSYALLGLFYFNIDSIKLSINNLNKAVDFSPGAPVLYPFADVIYLDDIFIALAEIHTVNKNYNQALEFAHKANRGLKNSTNYQSIVEAYNITALLLYELKEMDSSFYYCNKIDKIAQFLDNNNYKLVGYTGLIKWYDTENEYKKAKEIYKKGFEVIKSHENLNSLYVQSFLFTAIKILKKHSDYEDAIDALELKSKLNWKTFRTTQIQISGIENAALKKEAKVLKLSINEIKQNRRINNLWFAFIILILLLVSAGLLWYLYHQKQKLRVTNLKSKISRDLHDDIGASLSSIHIFGDLATSVWDTQPQQSKEMVNKITMQSKDLMERMSDIVWSLKPPGDEQNSLTIKFRNFSHDFLAARGIKTLFDIDEKLAAIIENPLVRTNLLLIAKEAMNNIAKYSGADQVVISLRKEKEEVIFSITDNGKGFDRPLTNNGNGLHNIEQRCSQLKGSCLINTFPGKGVTIICRFPVAIISHTD